MLACNSMYPEGGFFGNQMAQSKLLHPEKAEYSIVVIL